MRPSSLSNSQRTVLIVLMALGLGSALVALQPRLAAERQNRAVALAVDYNRAQEIAGLSGRPVADLLRLFKEAGATHAVIKEDSLSDLVKDGSIQIQRHDLGAAVVAIPPIRERIARQLPRRIPGATVTGDNVVWYRSAKPLDLLGAMGLGYPEEAVANVREVGLELVARPIGELTATRAGIDASLDAVAEIGADIVVFFGIQVLGTYDLVKYAGESMERRGIRFGYVEMAKQFGEAALASALKGKVIRSHAVAEAEMVKLPVRRAIDRYGLAMRERNVRLAYIRPYFLASEDPVAGAVELVAEIRQEALAAGLQPGSPEFYPDVRVAPALLIPMLAGVGAALIWLIQGICGLSGAAFGFMVAADLLLSAGAAVAASGMAQSIGALGAAVVFPTLALVGVQVGAVSGKPRLGPAILRFLGICAVGAAGGIIAAGMLSDLPHMMQIAAFRGVKLAQVLPLFVVFAVFVARCGDSYARARASEDGPEWKPLLAGLTEAAQAMVRYWHVGLIILGLVILALLLMRSGNVTPVPPSNLELTVRAALDDLLWVRPRTKEALFGHPILILSIAFLAAGWRRGAWIGILLGAIGQVSLVNTFGHIHTPLIYTLVRVLNGVWVGCALACALWLAWWIMRQILPRARVLDPAKEPESQ